MERERYISHLAGEVLRYTNRYNQLPYQLERQHSHRLGQKTNTYKELDRKYYLHEQRVLCICKIYLLQMPIYAG